MAPWTQVITRRFVSIVLGLQLCAISAPSAQTWLRALGSPGEEFLSDARSTGNATFMVGSTGPTGSRDGLVVKLNADGSLAWATRIGRNGLDEAFQAVDVSATEDIVLAGTRDETCWIVSLDQEGHIRWQRKYEFEPAPPSGRVASDIVSVSANELVFSCEGEHFSAVQIVRVDSNDGLPLLEQDFGFTLRGPLRLAALDGDAVAVLSSTDTSLDRPATAFSLDSLGLISRSREYYRDTIDLRARDLVPYRVGEFDEGHLAIWRSEAGLPDGTKRVHVVRLDENFNYSFARSIEWLGDSGRLHDSSTGTLWAGETATGEALYGQLSEDLLSFTWLKALSGPGTDQGVALLGAQPSGGTLLLGTTDSFGTGGNDFLIVALDTSGATETACPTLADVTLDVASSAPTLGRPVIRGDVVASVHSSTNATSEDLSLDWSTTCGDCPTTTAAITDVVLPDPPCPQAFFEFHGWGSGEGVTTLEWDFDHDGVTFDVHDVGTEVRHAYTEPGLRTVALRVTDSCTSPGAGQDLVTIEVEVEACRPDCSLRVSKAGPLQLTLARTGFLATDSLNVYEGSLGAYYQPEGMAACHVDAAGGLRLPGDGSAELDVTAQGGSRWFLTTASDSSIETSLGTDSLGVERDFPSSTWRCGPTP